MEGGAGPGCSRPHPGATTRRPWSDLSREDVSTRTRSGKFTQSPPRVPSRAGVCRGPHRWPTILSQLLSPFPSVCRCLSVPFHVSVSLSPCVTASQSYPHPTPSPAPVIPESLSWLRLSRGLPVLAPWVSVFFLPALCALCQVSVFSPRVSLCSPRVSFLSSQVSLCSLPHPWVSLPGFLSCLSLVSWCLCLPLTGVSAAPLLAGLLTVSLECCPSGSSTPGWGRGSFSSVFNTPPTPSAGPRVGAGWWVGAWYLSEL